MHILVIAFLEKVNYGGNFSPQGVLIQYIHFYFGAGFNKIIIEIRILHKNMLQYLFIAQLVMVCG
jgi:hypothetical protein